MPVIDLSSSLDFDLVEDKDITDFFLDSCSLIKLVVIETILIETWYEQI